MHNVTDVGSISADLQNNVIPPACRTSESITKADSILLMNYCYMDKETNRLVTNFATSR